MQTYGCDNCNYLKGKRCTLWEMNIDDPHNSHCESHRIKVGEGDNPFYGRNPDGSLGGSLSDNFLSKFH